MVEAKLTGPPLVLPPPAAGGRFGQMSFGTGTLVQSGEIVAFKRAFLVETGQALHEGKVAVTFVPLWVPRICPLPGSQPVYVITAGLTDVSMVSVCAPPPLTGYVPDGHAGTLAAAGGTRPSSVPSPIATMLPGIVFIASRSLQAPRQPDSLSPATGPGDGLRIFARRRGDTRGPPLRCGALGGPLEPPRASRLLRRRPPRVPGHREARAPASRGRRRRHHGRLDALRRPARCVARRRGRACPLPARARHHRQPRHARGDRGVSGRGHLPARRRAATRVDRALRLRRIEPDAHGHADRARGRRDRRGARAGARGGRR